MISQSGFSLFGVSCKYLAFLVADLVWYPSLISMASLGVSPGVLVPLSGPGRPICWVLIRSVLSPYLIYTWTCYGHVLSSLFPKQYETCL